MVLRIIKIGSSYGVVIPKPIVSPFLEEGFIDVTFTNSPYSPGDKKNPEIFKTEKSENSGNSEKSREEKIAALRELLSKPKVDVPETQETQILKPIYDPEKGYQEETISL